MDGASGKESASFWKSLEMASWNKRRRPWQQESKRGSRCVLTRDAPCPLSLVVMEQKEEIHLIGLGAWPHDIRNIGVPVRGDHACVCIGAESRHTCCPPFSPASFLRSLSCSSFSSRTRCSRGRSPMPTAAALASKPSKTWSTCGTGCAASGGGGSYQ